ncbi:ubiquitin-conjugating enzyme E2 G2 isoform X3 [Arvicanthis niloticus]|uniref:ubiquitin-conjugating enzyme E2 G2 isoform X3 n=1 Tax=Arvicanthis niloticus TaxID=61156 RepID=UPI00402B5DAC
MAGTALKRLMAEYKQLTLNPPEGIVAGPMNEENFFEWEALIMGPEDTCFEFGVFPAILSFPLDYPLSPPKMRFTCEMFHPNIGIIHKQSSMEALYSSGCLELLISCLRLPSLTSTHACPCQIHRREMDSVLYFE